MSTEAQPATQAKRVLVVEDEVMIRMMLEDMLGELGYTVAAEATRIDEAFHLEEISDEASARVAARAFRAWAIAEGLLAEES